MRAVIVANGPMPRPPFPRPVIRDEDLVICVDGGAGNALAMGLEPQVVIGDMDSIEAELRKHLEGEGCLFVEYPPRKDETDSELAVKYALSRGAIELILLAVLGGRIDHTLANVMLLAIPELEGIATRVLDGNQEVALVRDDVLIDGRPGDTISLLPLTADAVGVCTEGLEYPLRDSTLKFGAARGVSNVLVGSQARVRVGEGLLLLIHSHQPLESGVPEVDGGRHERDNR
jgi:thiamine pyrophosphokinase